MKLATWSALATLLASLICGVIGLFTTTVLFETAILMAISTGLGFIVVGAANLPRR